MVRYENLIVTELLELNSEKGRKIGKKLPKAFLVQLLTNLKKNITELEIVKDTPHYHNEIQQRLNSKLYENLTLEAKEISSKKLVMNKKP